MDREVFEQLSFWRDEVPDYPCPSCGRGRLKLKGPLLSEFTAHTNRYKKELWFDWEEHGEFIFSGLLNCGSCSEPVFIVGDGYPEPEVYDEEDGRPYQKLSPSHNVKYVQPHLKLIDYPEELSVEFKTQINSAFTLYFSNPSACCNSIRCAVEALLTEWGIPSKRKNDKHFPLSDRLDLLAGKYEEYRDLLVAVKWLGNSGSHAGQSFSHKNALDGFEMLEHVLSRAYDQLGPRLSAMAEQINAHKGPVRR